MKKPSISAHFQNRQPSSIRLAQIRFAERVDTVDAVNVAIGNVCLPMHPAMRARMHGLDAGDSPFASGVVPYSDTIGRKETNEAFLHLIASSGFPADGLWSQVTDGGSQAMELVIVGLCGPAGTGERPLLLIDAAYTNYRAFADRLGRATVSIRRTLQDDGRFTLPSLEEIEAVVRAHEPAALLVIPYDNPTGQCYDRATLLELARLCVRHGMWLVSDEAYRELHYNGCGAVSVWGITEQDVPGITGRRVSIETSSKVWNACGLRIGALVTDNEELHRRAVAENTASLCSNIIGQYIFGALAHEPVEALRAWYDRQRAYYRAMMVAFNETARALLPAATISSPDASLYTVVDVRRMVAPGFDATEFVLFCASEGLSTAAGSPKTLLTAPMSGFYSPVPGLPNPGRTQLRVAYVEPPERMFMVPSLLADLIRQFEERRALTS